MKALMKDRRQSNEGACDLDLQSTYSMTTSILLTHHRSINLTKEGGFSLLLLVRLLSNLNQYRLRVSPTLAAAAQVRFSHCDIWIDLGF